ncbi:benzoate transporter BenE [Pseudoxanthomonas winnipegensis]|jgi:benzoate membrane transport protein|uniref:Benzoate transporter BenE n=1 Tax=Pseudoxanthomonas winnipegensis TaxID=2480810 RepID=A0ABY1WJQ2_9GAMM|nr:benzoate/H(+) symporter BenE family transporter [Pseudoxanthomonas winnipegensis]TAA09638.1 benzoate transporter BenE [Pseudoxanthomonas winnipegensis]TAA22984.1 benzoate transporter BenE [Pseudoxanthomonas winnipegensis]TAH73395.1 benzoate transporter BenE [Pseudoxanthomonas winnipegensis]
MPALPARVLRDSSLSAMAAGFVTVLVGFASSVVIVFQAAQAVGASQAQIGSWILALGLGMGVSCIALSLRYGVPVVTAWSTPAAAMLAASPTGLPLPEAIGAFVVCAVLVAVAGFSGLFEKTLHRIPLPLAAGMLAGVLLRFGLDTFVALKTQPLLVLAMLFTYLAMRRWWARYAVIACLLVGVLVAAASGTLHLEQAHLTLAQPDWVTPRFSLAALLGIALPMFVVTMASQNVPGVAVIRASGFEVPVSPVIGWTGVLTALLAPLGAFSLNLAAITAAICMGPEAHPDRTRRYMAAVWAGLFYLVVGLFGATVVTLLAAFPKELVMAIAGIALLGTLGGALGTAVKDEGSREAALVTFLITASGLSLAGIGAAFWGLVGGVLTLLVLKPRKA